jgi:hypothetical protein
MFAGKGLGQKYRHGTEIDIPDFDFLAPATEHPVMSRRVALRHLNRPEDFEPEFFGMGPFQITYNFPSAIRRNKFPLKSVLPLKPAAKGEYGAAGWSFRMLYEFLSEAYNGGVPFVDTYFERIFKTRPVYTRLKNIYETIRSNINSEAHALFMRTPLKADGTPDMRYTAGRRFTDFKVWQDPVIQGGCEDLASDIRQDIEVCLRSGILPLRGKEGATVSKRTEKLRGELGGMAHPDRLFYASGQLIRHLNIYVEVGDTAA